MLFYKFKINKDNKHIVFEINPFYFKYKSKFFLRRRTEKESSKDTNIETDLEEISSKGLESEESKLEELKLEEQKIEDSSTEIASKELPDQLLSSTGDKDLDKVIELAGYAYDPSQDIFYSTLNPWQRSVGYCRLYDEAAAPLGMIVDCEPIYFQYDNRKWMISFWKGQYDLVTGGEIGVYTNGVCLNIPGFFRGNFYEAVSDDELLPMSFTLKKNNQILFTRKGKHWWLTGFKLGEFAEPSELTMDITLTFPNEIMRDAFLTGFRKVGYKNEEFTVTENTVSFTFAKPYTRQPLTRTKETDKLIQGKNKLLCNLYQKITAAGKTTPEKIKIIKEQAPELYDKILKLGKNKQFYEKTYVLIMIFKLFLTIFTKNKNCA
ncbi:MAG TPA: DUF4474 domain-containing protein [Peptococcaceae bacterium]|nr:DUF4474 domain-containing protein [Peptococcaceae bacterium]